MTSGLRLRRDDRVGSSLRAALLTGLLVGLGPLPPPGPDRGQEPTGAQESARTEPSARTEASVRPEGSGRPEGSSRTTGSAERCERQVVPGDVLEEAIRARQEYDITATPNQGRFLAELLLDLADRYRERRPDGPPLLIRQGAFFPAYLRVTGLTAAEAPPGFRKAYRHRQRMVVEYRRDRVLGRVRAGPEPRQALSVRAAWPDTGALPASYAYEDTASSPNVRVRQERNVTYRLLEYVAVVVYDRMEGVSGRPTSGALGALFDVLGMVEIRESRFVPAGGGAQLTYSRIRAVAPVETVATVTADGQARRGIPEDRPGLRRLRSVLERDLAVEYRGAPPPACSGEETRLVPGQADSPPAAGSGRGIRPTASSVALPR